MNSTSKRMLTLLVALFFVSPSNVFAFPPQESYSLALRANPGGTIVVGVEGEFPPGTRIELQAEANEGYIFAGWESPHRAYFELDPLLPHNFFIMPEGSTTVSANFSYHDIGRNIARTGDMIRTSFSIDLPSNQIDGVSLVRVSENDMFLSNRIPGFISNAIEVRMDRGAIPLLRDTKLIFELDPILFENPNFDPGIYFWNEERQFLHRVADVLNAPDAATTLSGVVDGNYLHLAFSDLYYLARWAPRANAQGQTRAVFMVLDQYARAEVFRNVMRPAEAPQHSPTEAVAAPHQPQATEPMSTRITRVALRFVEQVLIKSWLR